MSYRNELAAKYGTHALGMLLTPKESADLLADEAPKGTLKERLSQQAGILWDNWNILPEQGRNEFARIRKILAIRYSAL